jgi:PiT family inorganic phosphate transporter
MGIELDFPSFLAELTTNIPFVFTVIITFAVVMVNGWTDAANAIATCIGTRSLSPGWSIVMAAVFNFLGVFVMTLFNATVAQTIYGMVNFSGDPDTALIALLAALVAIVIWSVGAWFFGINTSESHALIAGVSGAAIALQGGISGINGTEWIKVIYGLLMSTFLGFGSGWSITKTIEIVCARMDRRKTNGFFRYAQITGAAGMAFMHGAQDGQKFMGVFMLGMFLSMGHADVQEFQIPVWLMLSCSVVMAFGTSIGGYKIIKKLGMSVVKLEKYQGFSADFASTASLFLTSILGIPVSTSHMKAMSIIGVGASKRLSAVNWRDVREIVTAWILTFPGCGLIGYGMAQLFMAIFS